MPRRKTNTITIVDWPKLQEGRRYPAKVKSVKLQRVSKCLCVTLENLAPTQNGRIHSLSLPLPVRPNNSTCAFVSACGIDATNVGTTIDIDHLLNRVIGLRPCNQETEEFKFEQIPNLPATETTASTPEQLNTERSTEEHASARSEEDL